MSVNIISQPPDFCFSGNQIVFVLQSSDYMLNTGDTFSGYIEQTAPWTDETSFVFQFGDERTVMQGSSFSDDSGTLFVVGDTAEVISSYFKKNYVLNNYYDITSLVDKITFTAKKPGAFYNWKPSPGLVITNAGQDIQERPGFKFLFEVFLENEAGTGFDKIYSEKPNADLPFTGTLSIDIHEILDAAMQPDIPSLNSSDPFRCKKSKRRYYCRYAEVHGDAVKQIYETAIFHVATGGLSYLGFVDQTATGRLRPSFGDFGKDRFLKQHTGPFTTRYNQPEFLYFINLRGTAVLYLKTKITYNDGETAELIAAFINSALYEKIGFPVGWDQQQLGQLQPDKIPVKFECSLVDGEEAPRSETITYYVAAGYLQWPRTFLYSSSLGTFDSFLVYGKQTQEVSLDQQISDGPKLIGYKITDGTKRAYALNYQRNFTVNTGWISEKDFELLTDFYIAEEKYLYKSGKLLPFAVTNKKFGEKKDGTTLIKQEISCTLNFTDDKFTDNDMEGSAAVIPPAEGLFHFGYSATRPLTAAAVLALPESQTDSIREFILNTGTTQRFFTIAFQSSFSLLEAFNQTSEEDVTSEFLANVIEIDVAGTSYMVCTAIAGVHYLVNQEIFIKIVNV